MLVENYPFVNRLTVKQVAVSVGNLATMVQIFVSAFFAIFYQLTKCIFELRIPLVIEDLIQQMSSYVQFSEQERELLSESLEEITIIKGEHILRIGQVCHHLSLIESGLSMHYLLHDGVEIPVDFQGEGEWVAYLKSFMNRTASDMGIKVLEDTHLYRLSAEKFQKLMELDAGKVMKLKNYYTEQSFIKNTQHSADMAMLSAKERYQKFVNENPALHNRIPQYYIAAYLGIKPQSLSRIRKEV
ncbi:MAG: hypothetical protein C5B59_01780 [Bacteroidetes bacterium]|nr:MAG: hypothetical protein C5B59_01780 [Bacteroidota bacterium]